jgi:hypothetical protein
MPYKLVDNTVYSDTFMELLRDLHVSSIALGCGEDRDDYVKGYIKALTTIWRAVTTVDMSTEEILYILNPNISQEESKRARGL